MISHQSATSKTQRTPKQELFRSLVFGTLIYAAVLGFFNDYTSILHTSSYSTTFLLAVLMQVLTMLTFLAKDRVVAWVSKLQLQRAKLSIAFGVWLVMFFSKFVFLGAICLVFRGEVQVSGFFGLIAIIVAMTLTQQLIELGYAHLGT